MSVENAVLQQMGEWYRSGKLKTFVPLLPALFNLRGEPYSLDQHFVFEPLFDLNGPRRMLSKTARQVGKTQNYAARALCMAATNKNFRVLVISPVYDQTLRYSNDAMLPLIEGSPFKSNIFSSNKGTGSVLRRELSNNSIIYFSYAYLSAERTRGYASINLLHYDELQSICRDHIPIINETTSAVADPIFQYTGTSLTLDNTLEWLWLKSGQAEWIIKCHHCGFFNIPAAAFNGGHLEKMIGPYRSDISIERPGLVCASCAQPVNPRLGRWVPRDRYKMSSFVGYHISQPIMPQHYGHPEKWRMLVNKQQGAQGCTTAKFYNECLGEALDVSTKLVNLTDLRKAACLHKNTKEEAKKVASSYTRRVLAADWGGGGEDGVSLTVFAVLGILANGQIEVIYGLRSLIPHDHRGEAKIAMDLMQEFQCDLFVHDYTGAGELRQTIMVHDGMPMARIMPISYVRAAAANVMNFHPATIKHPTNYWAVDKTRSLQLTCYSIKFGLLRFFEYDFISEEDPGLIQDFLALIENKIPTARGSDVYTIQRSPALTDDFAQAVNIGSAALFHMTGAWPNFSTIESSGHAQQELDYFNEHDQFSDRDY